LRKISLTRWIVIAMLFGIVLGWLFPGFSGNLQIVSNIFLKMIKSIIVPLLFSMLVTGIASHGDNLKAVGRLALKSIIYFEIVTTLALLIGLIAVNLAEPGKGVSLKISSPKETAVDANAITVQGTLEHVVPSSIFEAAAKNEVLQVVFFAVLFSAALTQVQGKQKAVILDFFEALAAVMFKFTDIVMKFSPFGVGAAMAYIVGQGGLAVLLNLGKALLTFYGAIGIFFLLVLLPVIWIAKIPFWKFFGAVREPALLAFSTASSEAAFPDAMKKMRAFGVPNRIVSFVLPTGYSFNLDGSTLYQAVASIFIAQAAGIHMSLSQQVLMMLMLMLTSKGTAGVPRSSLVVLSGTVIAFGLPLEGVAVLLGIDQLMDMARAMVNVIGNCLASAVVARWEGEWNTT
jgi:proton glutamate symport protein